MTRPLSPLTAAQVLGDEATPERLSSRLGSRGALHGLNVLPALTAAAAHGVVAAVSQGVLDVLAVDVGGIVLDTLAASEDLRKARHATRSGGTEVVDLGHSGVRLKRQPAVEILLGDTAQPIVRVELELSMEFETSEAAVTVRDGLLASVRTGKATMTVELVWQGQTLARRTVLIEPTHTVVGAPDADADARLGIGALR